MTERQRQERRSKCRDQNDFLAEWTNIRKPALDRLVLAIMSYYTAAEEAGVPKDDLIDFVGAERDRVGSLIHAQRRAADEIGIAEDMIGFDASALDALWEKLNG